MKFVRYDEDAIYDISIFNTCFQNEDQDKNDEYEIIPQAINLGHVTDICCCDIEDKSYKVYMQHRNVYVIEFTFTNKTKKRWIFTDKEIRDGKYREITQ